MFCRKGQTDLQDLVQAIPSLMHCTYYMGQNNGFEEYQLQNTRLTCEHQNGKIHNLLHQLINSLHFNVYFSNRNPTPHIILNSNL